MNIISFILSIPIKVYRKGFGWLYRRVKLEILRPKFPVLKYLVKRLEYLRRSFRSKKIVTPTNMVSSDTMVAVYDLSSEPVTFDFADFLAAAESYAKTHGKSIFFCLLYHVIDLLEPDKIYEEAVLKIVKITLNNIILPLIPLYPACVGHSLCRIRPTC